MEIQAACTTITDTICLRPFNSKLSQRLKLIPCMNERRTVSSEILFFFFYKVCTYVSYNADDFVYKKRLWCVNISQNKYLYFDFPFFFASFIRIGKELK